MTKKDYELLAIILTKVKARADFTGRSITWEFVCRTFADELAIDSYRFDGNKFLKACGVGND